MAGAQSSACEGMIDSLFPVCVCHGVCLRHFEISYLYFKHPRNEKKILRMQFQTQLPQLGRLVSDRGYQDAFTPHKGQCACGTFFQCKRGTGKDRGILIVSEHREEAQLEPYADESNDYPTEQPYFNNLLLNMSCSA